MMHDTHTHTHTEREVEERKSRCGHRNLCQRYPVTFINSLDTGSLFYTLQQRGGTVIKVAQRLPLVAIDRLTRNDHAREMRM